MAAEGDAKELNVHRAGYAQFVSLFKWGAIVSFITAMLVVFLIAE